MMGLFAHIQFCNRVQILMNLPPDSRKIDYPVDILLLCALKDEFDEVLAVNSGLVSQGWSKAIDSTGRIIAEAEFMSNDEQRLRIRTTWAGYMGREHVQSLASNIIKNTSIKCLAMSGICAGRRGSVELGDVIFGERLWSYDTGKLIVENGLKVFQGDMLQYRPTEIWVQHMQELKIPDSASWLTERPFLPYENQENWVLMRLLGGEDPMTHTDFNKCCPDWPEVLNRLWGREWVKEPLELTKKGQTYIKKLSLLYPKDLPKVQRFRIHVAPIATGAVLQEDESLFQKLSLSMRKVLGVEMEASGLASIADTHQLPVIVAKGVSDYGDRFKDDRYRKFAARASAEALILLLRNTSHLYKQNLMVSNQPLSPLKSETVRLLDPEKPDEDQVRNQKNLLKFSDRREKKKSPKRIIRDCLEESFNATNIRSFCFNHPELEKIHKDSREGDLFDSIIDRLIQYCYENGIVEDLWNCIEQDRENQYTKYYHKWKNATETTFKEPDDLLSTHLSAT